MKKIKLLAAVAAIIVALSSCQKEPANDLPVQSQKIKTYTEDIKNGPLKSVTTFNLSYDGSDRLVSMIDASNPTNKFLYAYPSASHYTLDIFANNNFIIHGDYFLNSHSILDSTFQYNNTDDSTTEKYTYNAAHQVNKIYEYSYTQLTGSVLWNTITHTYDGAGNLVKTEDTDLFTETYEYYPDLVYAMPQVIPITLPNKKSNLVKKYTLLHDGDLQGSVSYTYTFDSKDRLSTVTENYDDGTIVVKTYTYFD